jgi:hypothetical protein
VQQQTLVQGIPTPAPAIRQRFDNKINKLLEKHENGISSGLKGCATWPE